MSPSTSTDVWGHPTAEKGPTATETDLSSLNDDQLAGVIEAIDDGEIRLAQMAMARASHPEVKRFAHDILVGFEGLLGMDKALWSRLRLTPAVNAASSQVDLDAQKETARLAGVRRAEFDGEYLEAQVRAQTKALDLLDRVIANVKSASLKVEVTASRPKFERYLRMAESIREQEQNGPGRRQANTPSLP